MDRTLALPMSNGTNGHGPADPRGLDLPGLARELALLAEGGEEAHVLVEVGGFRAELRVGPAEMSPPEPPAPEPESLPERPPLLANNPEARWLSVEERKLVEACTEHFETCETVMSRAR